MILRPRSMSVERFTASELVLSPTLLLRSPFPRIISEHSPCSAPIRRRALRRPAAMTPKKKSEAIALTRPFIDPKTSSRRRGTKLLPIATIVNTQQSIVPRQHVVLNPIASKKLQVSPELPAAQSRQASLRTFFRRCFWHWIWPLCANDVSCRDTI